MTWAAWQNATSVAVALVIAATWRRQPPWFHLFLGVSLGCIAVVALLVLILVAVG